MLVSSLSLTKQLQEPEWLLYPLIRRSDFILLHGKSGVGKSRFSLALAHAIAHVEPVIYVDTETPLTLLGNRLLELHHPNLYFLLEATSFETLCEELLPRKFAQSFTIIIDNFSSNCPGVIQTDQASVASVLRPWGELVRFGFCTVIYLHHENRAGNLYGSAEFTRAPSGVFHLKEKILMIEKGRHMVPRLGSSYTWNLEPFSITERSTSPDAIRKRRQRERERRK